MRNVYKDGRYPFQNIIFILHHPQIKNIHSNFS
jgi:hypothetical protein